MSLFDRLSRGIHLAFLLALSVLSFWQITQTVYPEVILYLAAFLFYLSRLEEELNDVTKVRKQNSSTKNNQKAKP